MIGGGFFLAAITFKQKGKFSKLTIWLNKLLSAFKKGIFDKYGKMGVEALKEATPVETGKTANSWYYKISNTSTGVSICCIFPSFKIITLSDKERASS